MRCEARHAARDSALRSRGSGDMQNFWGVFRVSEIDSSSPGSFMLTVSRKQHYYFFTNSALHTTS